MSRVAIACGVAMLSAAVAGAQEEAVLDTVPACLVELPRSDAVCRSLRLTHLRFRALEDGDYANAFPPGPPECVDPPDGTRMTSTGRRAGYRLKDGTIGLWLIEVDLSGEKRWVLESQTERHPTPGLADACEN